MTERWWQKGDGLPPFIERRLLDQPQVFKRLARLSWWGLTTSIGVAVLGWLLSGHAVVSVALGVIASAIGLTSVVVHWTLIAVAATGRTSNLP